MGLEQRPEIHIYGNPAGLRALAEKLMAMAAIDQQSAGIPENDSAHTHYRTGCNTDLGDYLPRLTLGRVDEIDNPHKIRYCFAPILPDAGSSAIR